MTSPTSTRRRLVTGAVWATPAVLLVSPAPAIAASCLPGTVTWPAGGNVFTSGPIATSIPGLTVTVSTAGTGTGANNGNVLAGNSLLFTNGAGSGRTQTITFTFSQPVAAVQMAVADIDSGTNPDGSLAYWDRIAPSAGAVATPGTNLTTTSPYRPRTNNMPTLASDPAGQLGLSWTGTTSSVSITYSQNGTVSTNPSVLVTAFSFTYC